MNTVQYKIFQRNHGIWILLQIIFTVTPLFNEKRLPIITIIKTRVLKIA